MGKSNKDDESYTRIPNQFLEALYSKDIEFTKLQMRIIHYIMRKTFGWNKKYDDISVNRMAVDIGKKRRNVQNAVRDLEAMGIITVTKAGSGRVSEFSFNDIENWDRPAH